MKRPLKWKLFKIANIILFTVVSLSILLLFIGTFNDIRNLSRQELISFILVYLCFLIMLANYIFNFYILRKYFPNRLFTTKIKVCNLILLCINVLFWFVKAYAFYNGLMINLKSSYRNSEDNIILLILGAVIVIQGFILFLQFYLQSAIAKNNRESMLDLIDSLGDKNPGIF